MSELFIAEIKLNGNTFTSEPKNSIIQAVASLKEIYYHWQTQDNLVDWERVIVHTYGLLGTNVIDCREM
jgi:hypothetical protein